MTWEDIDALLQAAALCGNGTLVVNLASDDPLALLNAELMRCKRAEIQNAICQAARAMAAQKILLLVPENTDFALEKADTIRVPHSLVLRETSAVMHFLNTREVRGCSDQALPASLVVLDAQALLRYRAGATSNVRCSMLRTAHTHACCEVTLGTMLASFLQDHGLATQNPVLLGGLTGRFVNATDDIVIDECMDFDMIRVFDSTECLADAAYELMRRAQAESCQKCVLCREGTWHLAGIFADITLGKANRDSLSMVEDMAPIVAAGALCCFGRGMARLALSAVTVCREELDTHILRRQCSAGVCAALGKKTYAIDPQKCEGCGDCMDACGEDAITGKSNFIYMIDKDMCEGCGKCVSACGEGAIVIQDGSMRVPDKPTRVGRFR